jgi:hypothetical protein
MWSPFLWMREVTVSGSNFLLILGISGTWEYEGLSQGIGISNRTCSKPSGVRIGLSLRYRIERQQM